MIILKSILAIVYLLQYSGINFSIFSLYNDNIRYSLGNIIEIIPFYITGLLITSINVREKINKSKKETIIFCLISILFLFQYDIFNSINGYFYPGIMDNFGAILLFLLFSLL